MTSQSKLQRAATWMFVGCGVWMFGLGVYFLFVRPPLLPEDLRFLGWGAAQAELVPRLSEWLGKVFTVLGGFMAGAGVLAVVVAVHAVPRRLAGTGVGLACAGLLTVGTMSGINFALDSDFKWLLVAPALLWLAGLGCYSAGRSARG